MRRLGELHRLLNNRKGSLSATYKKNADANDKAHDPNQKSIQALDALAKEYVDFEATMANVTSEHEAGDEKTRPSTGRPGLLESCTNHGRQNFLTVGLHTKPRALNFATPSVKFATVVQAHEEICVDAKKALHEPSK